VDVERLLDGYDTDPIGALTVALRLVLDQPAASWHALVSAAPVDVDRRRALLVGDQDSLDALLRELNELRTLG
jgi:hypothetical protein